MADGGDTDLLMTFLQLNGSPVPGECMAEIDTSDKLMMKGFTPGAFCELQEFGLGLTLNDSEQTDNSLNQASTQRSGSTAPTAPVAASGASTKFAKWRSAKSDKELEDLNYSADMDPFEITRIMDKGSPILFQNCCNTVSFKSAALVKRKVTGKSNALQAFLRFEFYDVLIISLDWDNDKGIKEKCKFIYRSMDVTYRRQKHGGSLDAACSATWKQPVQLQGQDGQGGGAT